MATCIWIGKAQSTAQVNTVTPASVTIGNTFTITINGKSVTVTATAATVANVTGLLTTAFNASEEPEFQEITATDSTTHVTLTADTAGVPFTSSSGSATGAGSAGHSCVTATTTANVSPNDWSNATNWSGAAAPVDNDDVIISDSEVSILYGLAQSSVNLTSLTIRETFTGQIGLPDYTSTGYREYRDKVLIFDYVTTLNIEQGSSVSAGQIRLDTGTAGACTATIRGINTSPTIGSEALWLDGSNGSNVLNVLGGSVAVATGAGEVAQWPTINATDAAVRVGSGSTLGTINQSGGEVQTDSAVTTWTMVNGSQSSVRGAATITTLNADDGTMTVLSSGTITTLNVGNNASADFTKDNRARTVTNCTVIAGATVLDSTKSVTWTNGIDLYRCSLADITLDLGTHFTITPSAI